MFDFELSPYRRQPKIILFKKITLKIEHKSTVKFNNRIEIRCKIK